MYVCICNSSEIINIIYNLENNKNRNIIAVYRNTMYVLVEKKFVVVILRGRQGPSLLWSRVCV